MTKCRSKDEKIQNEDKSDPNFQIVNSYKITSFEKKMKLLIFYIHIMKILVMINGIEREILY
jgi:hypothetical protein